MRFRALPGELTFISQQRAGEADRDPVKDPIFVRADGAGASILWKPVLRILDRIEAASPINVRRAMNGEI
ncbi:MAG: hypothetical protein WCC90_03695 [Methylocella sp.]